MSFFSFLFFFFLFCFWFWSVLFCWAVRVGRDGLEEWKGWMGLEGEVVYYQVLAKRGVFFCCCNLEEEGEE